MTALLAGHLENWPSRDELANILRAAGLSVDVGQFAIRLSGMDHFVFQQLGGDRGKPCIDADAANVESLVRDARAVSQALSRAGLAHRFEVYNEDDVLKAEMKFP